MGEVSRIKVRDVELEFESEGEPSQGASPGETLLLVHGYTGSRDDFKEQLPRLARYGRSIAMDLRGHGASSNLGRPEAYTFDEMVADLAAFIAALDLGPLDLLGHSLGGMVTLRYALAHPERVRSLILMDTAPGPVGTLPKALREGGVKLARGFGMGKIAEIMRAAGEKPGAFPPATTACIERMGPDSYFGRIQMKMEQMDVEAFDALGELLAEHEAVSERLSEIDVPTLVMVGEGDTGLRPGADELAAGISNAHLEVIPNADHSPQHESPEAWLAAISDHLVRVRRAQAGKGTVE